jgi:lipopolysaccharide transport system permease protein
LSKIGKSSNKVIYTPNSRIRHPLLLFKEMWHDLLGSRELAWRLLVRDISAQYRQSLLGVVWAFVPPIVTAFGLVMARNTGIINIAETNLPYPAYVMFSMALWQTFVEALNAPIAAVGQAKPMLAKINFPREAIVLAKLGEVFFNFGIKSILILALFLWFQIPITWNILLSPVALVHLIVLGAAIGLLLAPIGTLYGDVSKALGVVVAPWLLLTPVIYPVPKDGWFGAIVNLNPVTPLLVTTRELATTGIISDPLGFWIASGIAVVVLLFAWVMYRLSMPFVIERMSS